MLLEHKNGGPPLAPRPAVLPVFSCLVFLLRKDQQLPLDGTAQRAVLAMVLRRQYMSACNCNLIAARRTTVNTRIRRRSAGVVLLVERRVRHLGQKLPLLVKCHACPFRVINACCRALFSPAPSHVPAWWSVATVSSRPRSRSSAVCRPADLLVEKCRRLDRWTNRVSVLPWIAP